MTGGHEFPYGPPAAFDAALTDRLRVAAETSPYTVVELRRQFAYDRLLTRAFAAHPDRWILKGGGGLLARIPGQARHSLDIDLFYRANSKPQSRISRTSARCLLSRWPRPLSTIGRVVDLLAATSLPSILVTAIWRIDDEEDDSFRRTRFLYRS